MKRIFFCLALACRFNIAAQPCPENFLGSKTLYQLNNPGTTPAPNGYLPVFINHVGRHGARHVTSDVRNSVVYAMLSQADSTKELTKEGQQLQLKVLRFEILEKQHFKSITVQGALEQAGIAGRMYSNYPSLFRRGVRNISVDYTKEIRTLQTSEAFLKGLQTNITLPLVTRHINDTTLRFYDLSPAYLAYKKNGHWIQLLERCKVSVGFESVAESITAKIFTPSWLKGHTLKDKEDFTTGLFGFVTILHSLKKEMEDGGYSPAALGMQTYFDCSQLNILSEIDNAEDYYEKGPGTDPNGIQVKIAAPLLADFISTTGQFLRGDTTALRLRFSHAETIAPFAALLHFEPGVATATSLQGIDSIWQAANIIPLSANIQWIVYQQKGNPVTLVKFLLNEKEVRVKGLSSKTYPYYNWEQVRKFYLQKLSVLKLGLEENQSAWLQQLK